MATVQDATTMLATLTEGCRQHQQHHDNNDQEDEYDHDDDLRVPEICRNVLHSLGKALPPVEAALRHHSQQLGLEHWQQWTDFYRKAGRGRFCPHAPSILEVCRDAVSALARIQDLWSHILINPTLLQTHALPYKDVLTTFKSVGRGLAQLWQVVHLQYPTLSVATHLVYFCVDLLDPHLHVDAQQPLQVACPMSDVIPGLASTEHMIVLTRPAQLTLARALALQTLVEWVEYAKQERIRDGVDTSTTAHTFLPNAALRVDLLDAVADILRQGSQQQALHRIVHLAAVRLLVALEQDMGATSVTVARVIAETVRTSRSRCCDAEKELLTTCVEAMTRCVAVGEATPGAVAPLLQTIQEWPSETDRSSAVTSADARLRRSVLRFVACALAKPLPQGYVTSNLEAFASLISWITQPLYSIHVLQILEVVLGQYLSVDTHFVNEAFLRASHLWKEANLLARDGRSTPAATPSPVSLDRDMATTTRKRQRLSNEPEIVLPESSHVDLTTLHHSLVHLLFQSLINIKPLNEEIGRLSNLTKETNFEKRHSILESLGRRALHIHSCIRLFLSCLKDTMKQKKEPTPSIDQRHQALLAELAVAVSAFLSAAMTHAASPVLAERIAAFVEIMVPYEACESYCRQAFRPLLECDRALVKLQLQLNCSRGLELGDIFDRWKSHGNAAMNVSFLRDVPLSVRAVLLPGQASTSSLSLVRIRLLGQTRDIAVDDTNQLDTIVFGILKKVSSGDDAMQSMLLLRLVEYLFGGQVLSDTRRFAYLKMESKKALIDWLLSLSVTTTNPYVCGVASRSVGKLLSPVCDGPALRLLMSDEDFHARSPNTQLNPRNGSQDVLLKSLEKIFDVLDEKLQALCGIKERGLSSTESPGKQKEADVFFGHYQGAIRLLTTFLDGTDIEIFTARTLIEKYLKCAIQLFLRSSGPSEDIQYAQAYILADLARVGPVFKSTMKKEWARFMLPGIFADVLCFRGNLRGLDADEIDGQCQLICRLIATIFIRPKWNVGAILFSLNEEIEHFVDTNLPLVMAWSISNEDLDTVLLSAALKLRNQGIGRQLETLTSRKTTAHARANVQNDVSLSKSARVAEQQIRQYLTHWTNDLTKHAKTYCLTPEVTEAILPWIFQRGQSRGVAHLEQLTNRTVTTMINAREQLFLKGFFVELCSDPALSTDEIAATIELASKSRAVSDSPSASEWVTDMFMYLLVNVVQYRWSFLSASSRARNLRCLNCMLGFLKASESPRFFPQIISTINASIGDSVHSSDARITYLQARIQNELNVLAISALEKFVKLLGSSHQEMLGQNLTVVVVSLIPVLSGNGGNVADCGESSALDGALRILDWLLSGDLGVYLAPYFSDIPFLPSSDMLDPLRKKLLKLGVGLDNLYIRTQGTQGDGPLKTLPVSDGDSLSSDGTETNSRRQFALKRRLRVVCGLLANENMSVRRVVLDHLVSLLSANRDLFESLVENENSTTLGKYVTLLYDNQNQLPRGSITDLVSLLLQRSVHETDPGTRILVGTCLGEIGAIGSHLLDIEGLSVSADASNQSIEWRLKRPPWRSDASRYKLQLVTQDLVVALRAAPSASDQHKVGFSIQQVLRLLDAQADDESSGISDALSKELRASGVFETVGPFWTTEFRQPRVTVPSQPPFFNRASNYYTWLSDWSRYMIHRACMGETTEWNQIFHACRTAIRTPAALSLTEFLFPLLVLDRLCYGDAHDESSIFAEFRDSLTFNESAGSHMDQQERRKAVNLVLVAIHILGCWSEQETEGRHKSSKRSSSRAGLTNSESSWPLDQAKLRIEDILENVPLLLRAEAAAKVGMHAQALRFLEFEARSSVAANIYDACDESNIVVRGNRSRACGQLSPISLPLQQDALAYLSDYETMRAVGSGDALTSPDLEVFEVSRQKEAAGDWESALQVYERGLQLIRPGQMNSVELHRGALRCNLELGHFQSVLTQVDGLIFKEGIREDDVLVTGVVPFGVEAAWRLGRWGKVSELLDTAKGLDNLFNDSYEVIQGKIMLGLHQQACDTVEENILAARETVMSGLASTAREGYSRSYDHLVQLHCLRELENAATLLCNTNNSVPLKIFAEDMNGGCWQDRQSRLSPEGLSPVIHTRLALSRLAEDTNLEASLFVDMGKRARKSKLYSVASNAFSQAQAAFFRQCKSQSNHNDTSTTSTLLMEVAKLKHETGEATEALAMLERIDVDSVLAHCTGDIQSTLTRAINNSYSQYNVRFDEKEAVRIACQHTLKSTQWMIDGSLKGASEIASRFHLIHRLDPKWEKGHFHYAKFCDKMLKGRIDALRNSTPEGAQVVDDDTFRIQMIENDKVCQSYLTTAVKHFGEAAVLDLKHVYQALPRLLSLWFEYTSISARGTGPDSKALRHSQHDLNSHMAELKDKIPAEAFYTALPQLISSVTHRSSNAATVVQAILRRVLVKFPSQAMWALAWLRQSKDSKRKLIGDNIFTGAADKLAKVSAKSRHHALLVGAQDFLGWLHKLAKVSPPEGHSRKIEVRPWQGEVSLQEFIPPVQAALTMAFAASDGSRSKDFFPRNVPRMNRISSSVQLMASKARPKKLKIFVVAPFERTKESNTEIGELHFLVKQEAKGDLRKDARVQDLNNVINRLMSSSTHNSSKANRRLHLRTFTVTCLSEDTGILEWVPNTNSLRGLISSAYNPQASPHSKRRRGSRLVDFADMSMRHDFERKCQEMFFKHGNLKAAAQMFDNVMLKAYPPVLYWWFVQKFHDAHQWYEARTRFTLSCAIWCAVGHVIGLGDRHAENILLDTQSGDCVHVDFDCIFDKGLHLNIPEVVPFRLTSNMVDAFGPTGTDGVFSLSLQHAMGTLRSNRDTLLSVLEPFMKDPIIDWKRRRSHNISTQEQQTEEAKRSIHVIDERLRGIYNLQNPNYKKIHRVDIEGVDRDEELGGVVVPLSVEGQVQKMIAEATSSENLVQLYVGWMPWV